MIHLSEVQVLTERAKTHQESLLQTVQINLVQGVLQIQ